MINTELHNGDCLEYMKKIPTSSIDLIITDPPYNLGKFMEERDTNLVKMRDNFFGAAGWDDLDYKEEYGLDDFQDDAYERGEE